MTPPRDPNKAFQKLLTPVRQTHTAINHQLSVFAVIVLVVGLVIGAGGFVSGDLLRGTALVILCLVVLVWIFGPALFRGDEGSARLTEDDRQMLLLRAADIRRAAEAHAEGNADAGDRLAKKLQGSGWSERQDVVDDGRDHIQMSAEELLDFLKTHLPAAKLYADRNRLALGRLLNRIVGANPGSIRLSGTRLVETLGVLRLEPETPIKANRAYDLRIELAEAAVHTLKSALDQSSDR